MIKRGCILVLLLSVFLPGSRANMVITPWQPIFKGVARASGTNYPDGAIPRLQVANCVRVDLSDPDVQLFHTPPATNYVAEFRETTSLTVSNFLQRYGVQVACTANFYNSAEGFDPRSAGIPCQVYGLAMSQGQTVSVPDFGPDSNNRRVSMLFTTNKEAFLVLSNGPPGTNTAGIYTAVSGYYPVLTNGVVLSDDLLRTLYPDPTIHDVQPRTAFGLSQDRRYLYLLIIDGRQGLAQNVNPPYSDGAFNSEIGLWFLQFGAWNGINMDGGGSTAMYMADCAGNPRPLGRSSYIPAWGRERYTGSHLGIYAPPLPAFISNVMVEPASVSATITWQTVTNASSQVEYGTTTNYGTLTPPDSTLVTEHSVTITNLAPLTRYYFRVISTVSTNVFTYACPGRPFQTTNFAGGQIFALTNSWRYSTSNLDGVNWTAPAYDDSVWPSGPAALWAHDGMSLSNSTSGVPNLMTRMPLNPATTYPFPTYYFRTQFEYTNSVQDATLIFSNFLDDGAVFYLNGAEIRRINMPAGPINNGTYALDVTCLGGPNAGNASCPIVFNITGNPLANLAVGTNVLAVEVHNADPQSRDVVFESALYYTLPPPPPPPPFFSNVVVVAGETNAVATWDTLENSTSQVFFGPTPILGAATPFDPNPVTSHAVVLNGLTAKTLYYFRVVSRVGTNEFTSDGTFTTGEFYQPLVTFDQVWRFTTNRLNGLDWMFPEFDDSDWIGSGPALLYNEENVAVLPRNTEMPLSGTGSPYPTYYFRTYFELTNCVAGYDLVFTNYIDDGAVFYLNGAEIRRIRMPAGPVTYETFSSACPVNSCDSTADVPDVFRLTGHTLTNLVPGNNFLAVEVHQVSAASSDVVFGSEIGLARAPITEAVLRVRRSNNVVCIEWDGSSMLLQSANAPRGSWTDVPGPVRSGPYCVTNLASQSVFFRLRQEECP